MCDVFFYKNNLIFCHFFISVIEKSFRSTCQLTAASPQLQSDNSVPAENGSVNDCPVQIKVYRDDDSDGVVKQPSYVSLARCISGYTLLTTYDSKQREGFRSRDISPARVPLPIPVGPDLSNQGKNSVHNGDSYLGVDCQQESTIKSPQCLSSPVSSVNDYSASNILRSNTNTTSSIGPSLPCMDTNMESKSCTVQSETTSFVLQRVERLYGPGALAQGFYARHNARRSLLSHDDHSKSNGSSPVMNGNSSYSSNFVDGSTEESLPVLKLLRPEFRAQLSVARHKLRSASVDDIDGTPSPRRERIIPITLESSTETPKTTKIFPQKNGQLSPSQVKDGHYYLQVVHNEMSALQRLADELQSEMSSGTIPEELDGQLRSAIGKARLLVAEKLRQFEGLCQKNISQDLTDNFRTTDEDLAGFWDMVLIQVDSVHKEYDNIAKLRDNGWKQIIREASPVTPKINSVGKPLRRENIALATVNNTNKSSAPAANGTGQKSSKVKEARDEARRKLLQERKMAMKKNMSATANQDQVFIS